MVLSRKRGGWVVYGWVFFFLNPAQVAFSRDLRMGIGDWYGGIRFASIGLVQAPPRIMGHRIGLWVTITSGPWEGVLSVRGVPCTWAVTSYRDLFRNPEGKSQTDEWQDLRVFQAESFEVKGAWSTLEAEVTFAAAPPLVVTAGVSLRHLDRPSKTIQVEIFTVDWLQSAWYAEGRETVSLSPYRRTRLFGTGGAGLRRSFEWIPLTVTGGVVFYAPFQKTEDLWLSWQAEAILRDVGPLWLHLGYREDLNAHVPTRERIWGGMVSLSYRL